MIRRLALLAIVLIIGCSSDPSGVDDPGNPDDPADPTLPTNPGDTPPINLVDCEKGVDNVRSNALQTTSDGDVEYVVGGFEIAADDHDPYVARIDAGILTWCGVYSQATSDEHAALVALASDDSLWVAIRTTSGTELQASEGAFQPGTGSGDGEEIIFLANLALDTGAPLAGTFVHAVQANGDANTMRAQALSITTDDRPELVALSEDTPPPFQPENCAPPSPYQWKGEFSKDLTTLVEVSADRCRLE